MFNVPLRNIVAAICLFIPICAVAEFEAAYLAWKKGDISKAFQEFEEPLAIEKLQESAIRDNYSKYILASLYNVGHGVPLDRVKYLDLLNIAANSGIPEAEDELGSIYYSGWHGFTVDYKKALYWYGRAASSNNPNGLHNLADMYDHGIFVTRDYNKAIFYFQKAAELGYVHSQNRLGIKYAEGTEIKKNMVNALKWFTIAAISGNDKAVYNRDRAEKLMSSDDISRAQELATSWLKRKKPI